MRHRCIPLTGSEECEELAEIIVSCLPDNVFGDSGSVDNSFCLLSCQHPEKAPQKRGKFKCKSYNKRFKSRSMF